ncbi:MAG: hypothetical protein WCT99_00475 [Bacteroidota bacterium]
MKNLFVAGLFALLLIGCDKSNPSSVPADTALSLSANDVAYSETSMYSAVVASNVEFNMADDDSAICDSLHPDRDSVRHFGRMLGLLKHVVGLTDAQFDSVKIYAQTLFDTLHSIHTQVRDSSITKAEARVLVQAARDQFIVSVQSILTADQLLQLDEWALKFWNRHHERGRGHGHHHGERDGDHP